MSRIQLPIDPRDLPPCSRCKYGEDQGATIYCRVLRVQVSPDFCCRCHSDFDQLDNLPPPKDVGQFGWVVVPERIDRGGSQEADREDRIDAFEGINVHKGTARPGSPVGCLVPEQKKSEGDGKEGSGGEG